MGVDWYYTFSRIDIFSPYDVRAFTNPPWAVFFLPHALFLPLWLSDIVNRLLNIAAMLVLVHRFGGRRRAWLLIFSFPPFFDLMRTNNIDWIPMLSLAVPPLYGLPMLLVKPQSLGGVVLIWFKRHNFSFLWLAGGVFIASFAMWGWWPPRLHHEIAFQSWNFAPFPLLILPGGWLLYRAWHDDDEALAAVSTVMFMPYIAAYSLVGPFVVLAARWPRFAAFVSAGFWWFVLVEIRRIF